MRRREFLSLFGGAALWPLSAYAQQPATLRRVAFLSGSPEGDRIVIARFNAFTHQLQLHGWVEGRNVTILQRDPGDDLERLRVAAQEVVAFNPDVICVTSNPAVEALRQVNRTIPAVFTQVGDPVGSGFVASMAKPGGNLTGFVTTEPAMGGKWVELLTEAAPNIRRVLVLQHRMIKANAEYAREAAAAGRARQIDVSAFPIIAVQDIERAIPDFAREPDGGVIALPNPITGMNAELIAKLAVQHRLPTISSFRSGVEGGELLSYGPDGPNLFRQAADYVDRVLRGAKPGDLPIQGPTKFELVVNLKTAKALGLSIPDTLLSRVDDIIE